MDEQAALTELCLRLGSSPTQADTMARQLLKRADQLAAERGLTREAALEYLLQLVVKGRNGETVEGLIRPPRPAPGAGTPPGNL